VRALVGHETVDDVSSCRLGRTFACVLSAGLAGCGEDPVGAVEDSTSAAHGESTGVSGDRPPDDGVPGDDAPGDDTTNATIGATGGTTSDATAATDTTDGDASEGTTSEGTTNEGTTTEGTTNEGTTNEGTTNEGTTNGGTTTEGTTTEGTTTEGTTNEGATTEGATTEGTTTEGTTTDGMTTGGTSSEGSTTDEGTTSGTTTEGVSSTGAQSICGNGIPEGDEECDDGNADNHDECLTACLAASCGDGFLNPDSEECDDGNFVSDDGCDFGCIDPCGPAGVVIYVDVDATGANDGTSWQDAFTSVQAAMLTAGVNDELWVAEGEYRPVMPNAPVVSLATCVNIYGGFIGTEDSPLQRPTPLAPTLFDGDVDDDDAVRLYADNSRHVIVGAMVDLVRVDGVSVTGGRAIGGGQDDDGGGAMLIDSNVDFVDVAFSANHAAGRGGGIFADGSTADITRGVFTENSGLEGGGLHIVTDVGDGPSELDQCAWVANTASLGAGLYAYGPAPIHVLDSTFGQNAADVDGGAMWMGSPGTTTSVAFEANTAQQRGGAVMRSTPFTTHIWDEVTFVANFAGTRGGAMSVHNGYVSVRNALFDANQAVEFGGAVVIDSSDNAEIVDAEFLGNVSTSGGGAIFARATSSQRHLSIERCRFVGNGATGAGADGGAIWVPIMVLPDELRLTIASSHFEDNSVPGDGGALYVRDPMRIYDSVFRDNTAGGEGGAIFAYGDAWSQLESTSIGGNMAGGLAGGMFLASAGLQIRNTVMWGNGTDMEGEGFADIDYTCSEQFLGIGLGNVLSLSNPFVDGPDGELFLDEASVCVDEGSDAIATSDYDTIGADWQVLTTSMTGELDASPVDMGAHYLP
jgi:cysteine-rich repeat protein/predicted outer membrane repeat protein